MKVVIIGGGVAGLVSAINLARKGIEVTILERNNKCGKKILLTGNGRCNFWNKNQNPNCYYASDKELFKELFNAKKDLVLDFVNSIGIIPKEINGYYYPYSNQAQSFYNSLLKMASNLKVNIKTDIMVSKIVKKNKFLLTTNKGLIETDKVIIATGGKTYSKTGSDGNGYDLVKSLNHKVNTVLPSLTKLIGKDNFKDLKGVRSEVILTLYEDNKEVKKEHGELIFTDNGISGICVFNLSGIASRGLNNKRSEKIFINFVPWFNGNHKDLIKWLDNRSQELKGYSLCEILEGFLNYKIVNYMLKTLHIDVNTKWEKAPKEKVVELLMSFPFWVVKTGGFEEAQVTTGGVPIEEVNIKTMESLKTKGLYLVGEILDVDGICGGYNIGFAIMTGLTVGSDINA